MLSKWSGVLRADEVVVGVDEVGLYHMFDGIAESRVLYLGCCSETCRAVL